MKPIIALRIREAWKSLMPRKPIKEKETVLKYLRNGKDTAAYAGIAKDILTGEEIPGQWLLLSDGVFEWSTDEIYYFEKYNIKLEDEFIEYVLKKQ